MTQPGSVSRSQVSAAEKHLHISTCCCTAQVSLDTTHTRTDNGTWHTDREICLTIKKKTGIWGRLRKTYRDAGHDSRKGMRRARVQSRGGDGLDGGGQPGSKWTKGSTA